MNRINKQSIYEILSQGNANKGMHTDVIATHLFNRYNSFFEDAQPLNYDEILKRIKVILTADVYTRKGFFARVINASKNKPRRGYFKIRKGGLIKN
ncbi:MAG: hypothetical protein LBT35_03960 [Tannerella sp.]|jgi:hypothetical protein|nr:hypothetical protein [Tannerella sp.]